MQTKILKLKTLVLSLILLTAGNMCANAADMSALDFNGDFIGKVIPDGSVISSQNELLGHITADGYVVDDDNNLIGGMVPQGIAISVNNSILGKVNNDGSVTTEDDSLVGKVLPNGLVVDINYNVLGAVIAPGLVYNDEGNIIGRISGDGQFYNLAGDNSGFVTASGYVYTTANTDRKAALAGKLTSSKMVISANGRFLGSVTPDGKVMDLKKNIIGNIHANNFVYSTEGFAIGHVVEKGYAFNFDGTYLGIISYNGEVINKGETVGSSSFGNRIIGKDGRIVGFSIDISATANTLDGKYLGYIANDGNIIRGKEIVGKIGASGNVIDSKGQVIGLINQTGPIFDYLGEVNANAAVNGSVVSLNGIEQGFMQKKHAYDYKGKELGRILGDKLNFDTSNNFIGLSGITSILSYQGKTYTVSPYGYVFDENKNLSGKNFDLLNIYSPDGKILTSIIGNGKTDNLALNEKSKLTSAGYLIAQDDKLLGKIITSNYATDFRGNNIGYVNPTNLIIDAKNTIYGKILPDGRVIDYETNELQNLGYADDAPFSISINGDYLGSNRLNGEVRRADEVVGKITSNKYVIDNMGALYGKTIPYGAVISSNCKLVGVVSDNGDARTTKNNYLGMVLANNQVVNDDEEVIGYVINPMAINGKKGAIIGIETPLGTVLNYKNQNLGCQDINGKIRNNQKEIVGQIVPVAPVMDFENKVIGYTNFNGNIEDATGNEIGYIDIEGGAQSSDGTDIGSLFTYTVAFDANNTYIGQVDLDGNVINENGENIGKVNYDGAVLMKDGNLGYALYDLYVYDNDGNTIGYIAKNGRVYSIMGDNKGSLYKGFCLDKKQNLIGRGARDYYIRDNEQKVIGYLSLDGKVSNSRNIEIGELGENGNVVDAAGKVIAIANPLQYYQKEPEPEPEQEPEQESEISPVSNAETSTTQNQQDEEEPEEEPEEDETEEEPEEEPSASSFTDKIIGVALSPTGKYLGQVNDKNEVIGSDGKVLYRVDADGNIIDENGNKVGTFQGQQTEKPKTTNTKWFQDVVRGVTISPHDYTDNVSNVGEGGGIGPGGRYNPRRAAILGKMYAERRQMLKGVKISNEADISVYTGWQEDWKGVYSNKSVSTLRVDMSNMITADKPIPAVIARTVLSLGEAPITAIVERNVYGDAGRNVIIPAGSRIIGVWDYESREGREDEQSGGIKIALHWERIIRPDGIAFKISDSQTGDAQGRGGGALGYVDEQLLKKYAMPLFGNIATSAISYMMAANQDATGETETSKQQAANDARENFLNKMNSILDKIMDSKEQIVTVTYIPAGTRVIIYPMSDLWLRTVKDAASGGGNMGKDDAKHFIDDDEAGKENQQQKTKNQERNQQPVNSAARNNPQQAGGGGNNAQGQQKAALPPPAADGSSPEKSEEVDPFSDWDKDSF